MKGVVADWVFNTLHLGVMHEWLRPRLSMMPKGRYYSSLQHELSDM